MIWLPLLIAGLVLVIVPGLFAGQITLGIALLALAGILLALNVLAANAVRKSIQRAHRRF